MTNLLEIGKRLGHDICLGQTVAPFYRQQVFPQIKPTTRGLIRTWHSAERNSQVMDRYRRCRKGDHITHRIEMPSLSPINDEGKRWLKTAYDLDG